VLITKRVKTNTVTPIDPQNFMYGVMIHAQPIQTILDQAWLRNMSFPELAAVIFCLLLWPRSLFTV